METDLFLELTPGGVLRWRRCARCGEPLDDDSARRHGFDSICLRWAGADPQRARRTRAKRIADDRVALAVASPFR
jgi:hypothetical protein